MKVLITGASSGIGKDMAKILGKKGYSLVLVARDEKRLNRVKEEIGNEDVEIVKMDLSIPENCITLHNMIKNVDILINNARFWGLW